MQTKTIGYARTATSQGDMERQIAALKRAGCVEIYTDKAVSGNAMHRGGLSQARAALQAGDTLLVESIDRLFRNVGAYSQFTDDLKRDGITLRCIDL